MAGLQPIGAAVARVQSTLRRRPQAGIHDDAPATALWQGGARCLTRHPGGAQLATDMPAEFGGSGMDVTPGWLFRAGLASCAATSVVLVAAAHAVDLEMLEVHATSRSDARGLVGVPGLDGAAVPGGPFDVQLHIRIAARDCPSERLQQLVREAIDRSPVPSVVRSATVLGVRIDVAAPATAA